MSNPMHSLSEADKRVQTIARLALTLKDNEPSPKSAEFTADLAIELTKISNSLGGIYWKSETYGIPVSSRDETRAKNLLKKAQTLLVGYVEKPEDVHNTENAYHVTLEVTFKNKAANGMEPNVYLIHRK